MKLNDTRRSQSLETAALILAVISVIGCTCLYASLICGSLAVIFAFLSKGGTTSMSRRSMTAACIAAFGIIICIVFYVFSYYTMIHTYGSLSNALQAYFSSYGIDYNSIFPSLAE